MVIVATTLKVPHYYNYSSLKDIPLISNLGLCHGLHSPFFVSLFSELKKCHWIGFFVMLKNNKKVYKILDYTN